jgi:uncharacterized protein
MKKRFFRKLGWYALSLVLFWNALVAIRAWRFTNFSSRTTLQLNKAGFLNNFTERFAGQYYYKSQNQHFPQSGYQSVYLFTESGLRLEGWYIKTPQPKGTVIIYHGLMGSKQHMLRESEAFLQMGYNTLLMDFRAHGGSDGYQCTLGMNEAEDVKLAYEYIRGKGEENIVLFGSSMGAATITHAVSKFGLHPNKLILDMPFANYEDLIKNWFRKSKYPKQPTAKLFTFWAGVLNNEWLFDVKPSQYVRNIHCPILLQWGRHDELIMENDIRKIYNNIAATDKQLIIYENSNHMQFLHTEQDVWLRNVDAFLQKH